MAELSERDRKIVYLYFFEECTQSEISEQVGVSQVHVSRLLRSSLAQLKESIGPDVVFDDSDADAEARVTRIA